MSRRGAPGRAGTSPLVMNEETVRFIGEQVRADERARILALLDRLEPPQIWGGSPYAEGCRFVVNTLRRALTEGPT